MNAIIAELYSTNNFRIESDQNYDCILVSISVLVATIKCAIITHNLTHVYAVLNFIVKYHVFNQVAIRLKAFRQD